MIAFLALLCKIMVKAKSHELQTELTISTTYGEITPPIIPEMYISAMAEDRTLVGNISVQ